MRVLLVEDDEDQRRMLGLILTRLGYESVAAASGEEALGRLASEDFSLVLTDLWLPGISGAELCRRVRAAGKNRRGYTYMMILTAHGDRKSYIEGLDAGADDFLEKGLDPDQLGARLRVAKRTLGLIEQVGHLEDLLPICSYCKKIRDDKGYWTAMEDYIASRTETRFSHGICPTCLKRVEAEMGGLPPEAGV